MPRHRRGGCIFEGVTDDRTKRTRLTVLHAELLGVHKALLAIARADYERTHGIALTPGALLQLLIQDDEFAWLHSVSELAARAGAFLEKMVIPEADLSAIGRAADELLTPDEGGTGFAKKYFAAIQGSPDVAMAHAGARLAIAAFIAQSPG